MKIIPNHVVIIPDGNRRYAEEKKVSLSDAYWKSIQNSENCVGWFIKDFKVPILSIYTLSFDNVSKRQDLLPLYKLMTKMYKKWIKSHLFHETEVKVKFVGEVKLFPKFYKQVVQELEEATSSYKAHKLYLLAGYSGQLEIAKTAQKFEFRNNDTANLCRKFLDSLDVKEPVDLLIRTAGEHRISDCLPYQSSYAEFVFLDKYFPSLTKEDIEASMLEFSRRKRKFGR